MHGEDVNICIPGLLGVTRASLLQLGVTKTSEDWGSEAEVL